MKAAKRIKELESVINKFPAEIDEQKSKEKFARLCPGDYETNLKKANEIDWTQLGKDTKEGHQATEAAYKMLQYGSLSREEMQKKHEDTKD
jgi:hypothetical protein